MEKKSDPKHVYVFGNKHIGFHGHSYDKKMAHEILKYRKDLKMVKLKNDVYCKENLSINTEFLPCYGNIYITANEEEFFIESFQQFQDDSVHTIDRLIESLKYIRFTDDEQSFIEYLITYLLDYQDFMIKGRYEDDTCELYDELFDNEAALHWFVKNVL